MLTGKRRAHLGVFFLICFFMCVYVCVCACVEITNALFSYNLGYIGVALIVIGFIVLNVEDFTWIRNLYEHRLADDVNATTPLINNSSN